MSRLTKETVIYGCAIDVYNIGHQKFKLRIKPDVQEEYALLFRHRWYVDNPLLTEDEDAFDVDISVCPADETSGWTPIELETLEELREELEVPTVTEGNVQAFDDFSLGTFARLRGSDYVAGLRHHELMAQQSDFETPEDFMAALDSLPKITKLWRYHQETRPQFWCDAKHGAWPERGCSLYSIRLPSANRSNSQPGNFKHPVILIENNSQPSNILRLKDNLACIKGWKCHSPSGAADMCSRLVGAGSHVLGKH